MRRRSWGYSVGVLGCVACLLAAGGWLSWELGAQLTELDAPEVPVVAEVREASLDYSSAASLSGRRVAPEPVAWNGSSGTVTAIRVAVSEELVAGSAIVDVDGVTRRAYVADTSLFRPLSRGDTGADVKVAQELLNVLVDGVSLPTTGTFGSATRAAVREYERLLGVTPTGVLDPTWFVLLPTDRYRVGSVSLRLGQPAPAAGEAFLGGVSSIEGMTLTADVAGPDGDYLFWYRGAQFAVSLENGAWTLDDAEPLASLLNPTDEAGSADAEAPEGEDPASVGGSVGAVTVEGRVALANPEPGQAVPPAALVMGSSGEACVVTADDLAVVEVRLLGSAVDGSALIGPDLADGTRVLVNPAEIVPRTQYP